MRSSDYNGLFIFPFRLLRRMTRERCYRSLISLTSYCVRICAMRLRSHVCYTSGRLFEDFPELHDLLLPARLSERSCTIISLTCQRKDVILSQRKIERDLSATSSFYLFIVLRAFVVARHD